MSTNTQTHYEQELVWKRVNGPRSASYMGSVTGEETDTNYGMVMRAERPNKNPIWCWFAYRKDEFRTRERAEGWDWTHAEAKARIEKFVGGRTR